MPTPSSSSFFMRSLSVLGGLSFIGTSILTGVALTSWVLENPSLIGSAMWWNNVVFSCGAIGILIGFGMTVGFWGFRGIAARSSVIALGFSALCLIPLFYGFYHLSH